MYLMTQDVHQTKHQDFAFVKNFVQENSRTMEKWLKRKAQELAAKRDATQASTQACFTLWLATAAAAMT